MHAVSAEALEAGPPSRVWRRLRFVVSWALALGLVAVGVPQAVDLSWHGVLPVLRSLHWPAVLGLVVLWFLGLVVHSSVLTAAAPSLTHRRALALNLTGSAVSNVVPLGGAAGIELNRRMMRAWGIDARRFAGYTFLTNLVDVGSKLVLPVIAVVALVHAGESVTATLRYTALLAGLAFVGLAACAAAVLASPRCTVGLGRAVEWVVRRVLRGLRRPRELDVVGPLLDVRRECARVVADGWLPMSLGISGYVALQGLLLGLCLHVTHSGVTWPEVLAGFALERTLTVLPVTPGGVGVADVGLVGILMALGGDPAGAAAGAVLYRGLVFALEIPVGGGTLGVWLLGRRRAARRWPAAPRPLGDPRRVAHVTDVFLPRLGGIETHVDDLVRHQRARGLDAVVLTPTTSAGPDPAWVRRLPAAAARRLVTEYDVVHVHVSMLSPYGIGVARAAMAAGVPTLVTVHSMWAGAGGLLRLAAVARLRRWPVVWSAVSGAAAETFRRSLHGRDVAVLPNAIDVEQWRRPASPARPTDPTGAGPITLVSVMRLMPRKRPLPLVRAFEQVRALAPERDVRLLVVGDGRLRGRVERYVRRRGLTDCVRVTGRIPRSEVLGHLLSASVYVAPAPKESFGLAALEARCAGLPVVANRRSGVSEFIRDRMDGVLVADDAEMVVALADLVLDATLRERIAEHNRRVAPACDWVDALDRTDALYRLASERLAAPVRAPEPLVPALLEAQA
ncbi:glycosyltransferase [Nocardioides sp.]|uniref:glycosyltransferase n=1 Tax=Nocardioides sp. TaxID=35761 RepID=UPI0026287B9E|nr:glycosyltransferase [Nocardioides sp.]MDI6912246.1 glycosyltransferase [Nocardioides sp.]